MDVFQAPNLGACCACGCQGDSVRNIVALRQLAPQPGTGWGCTICGLPNDGAVAVLCDACLHANVPIRWIVDGYAVDGKRVPIGGIPAVIFQHDPQRHLAHDRAVYEHTFIGRSRVRAPQEANNAHADRHRRRA